MVNKLHSCLEGSLMLSRYVWNSSKKGWTVTNRKVLVGKKESSLFLVENPKRKYF